MARDREGVLNGWRAAAANGIAEWTEHTAKVLPSLRNTSAKPSDDTAARSRARPCRR